MQNIPKNAHIDIEEKHSVKEKYRKEIVLKGNIEKRFKEIQCKHVKSAGKT